MALDGIILSKIKDNLNNYLPIRINRITQVSMNEIVFNVHAKNERKNLLISCHSIYNRIHFTNNDYSSFDEPTGFIMLLRKHIQGGIIEEIIQNDYDRYLVFKIRSLNDMYDETHYTLHIELMGKYANIILVDETGHILDALKRIPPFENNKRTIWPTSVFEYPEVQIKKDPFISNEIDEDKSLVSQFQGFSPLLSREIEYRLNNSSFRDIMNEISTSGNLYISEDNDINTLHIIPLLHTGKKFKAFMINEGFDYIYYQLEENERIKLITGNLSKTIKRQIKHLTNKVKKLEDSLNEALNAAYLRDYGDLLYTYSNLTLKGLDRISLTDFYGNDITIPLDPKRNIKENANRYYLNYQKKRKSEKFLIEQLEITEDELDYFISIDEQLTFANYEDALMIKDEMISYGYLKDTTNRKKKKKKKELLHLYQVEFEGYHITFGKNNIQNETLTFNYAKKNYTWFHAKQFHGAHLCIDSDHPSENAIRFAANLAAYFSKGRLSSSVGVDYCLVKDVKKIKGSKAGKVSIHNYKTIFIDPELDSEISFTII